MTESQKTYDTCIPSVLKHSEFFGKCKGDLSFNLHQIIPTKTYNSQSLVGEVDLKGLSCLETKGLVLEQILSLLNAGYIEIVEESELELEELFKKLENLSSLKEKELIKEIIRQKRSWDWYLGSCG